jgi:hypothetical protein
LVKRHNRLLVALYVCSDAVLGIAAFVLAYVVRFESGLIPITKGIRPSASTSTFCRSYGVLVPFRISRAGLYPPEAGRSRVDDFFAVFVGSILAVVFGIIATLYVQAYYVPDELKDRGAYEVSQIVWGLFLSLNVLLTYASRELVREALGAPVAGRHRPQTDPDCRRRRARAARRGSYSRAPRARLPRCGFVTTAPAATTSGIAAYRFSARWTKRRDRDP